MDIVKAIHRGAPFFSFLIGIGIAALLFHREFAVLNTLAIPLAEIEGKIVRSDGKCYRHRVEDATCENLSSV
jgi:hypothetical protein